MRQVAGIIVAFVLGVVFATWWLPEQPTEYAQPSRAAPADTPRTPRAAATAAAETDSQAQSARAPSLTAIAELRSDFEQTLALHRLLEHADVEALLIALDDAARELRGSDRIAASSIIYGRLAELDAEAALQHLAQRRGRGTQQWLHAVFHAWSRVDLEAARRAVNDLTPSQRRIAVSAMIQSQHSLAAPELEELAREFDAEHQLPLAEANYAAAWQQALSLTGTQRHSRLARIAYEWVQSDPAAALAASETLQGNLRNQLLPQVLNNWLQQDPLAALDAALNLEYSHHVSYVIQGMFDHVAQIDPIAAELRAETLTDRRLQGLAIAGIARGYANSDPQAAMNWLDRLRNPDLRSNAIGQIASGMARRSMPEIDAWLATLSTEEVQMAESILHNVGGTADPEKWGERVLAIDDAQRRERATRSFLNGWMGTEPAAAANWLTGLPKDERVTLYKQTLSHWSRQDYDAAKAFVERRVATGTERDTAYAGLVSGAFEPQELRRIIDRISDPELKREAASHAYRKLMRTQPDAADEFAAVAGINR